MATHWSKLTKQVTRDAIDTKQSLPASLEGSDAELCIVMFKSTLNFRGLKKRITTSDQEWMEQFLEQGGLETVFDALSILGQKGFSKRTAMMDAIQQLECIACIKTIMSRPYGMKHTVMNGEKFVKRFIEGQSVGASDARPHQKETNENSLFCFVYP